MWESRGCWGNGIGVWSQWRWGLAVGFGVRGSAGCTGKGSWGKGVQSAGCKGSGVEGAGVGGVLGYCRGGGVPESAEVGPQDRARGRGSRRGRARRYLSASAVAVAVAPRPDGRAGRPGSLSSAARSPTAGPALAPAPAPAPARASAAAPPASACWARAVPAARAPGSPVS